MTRVVPRPQTVESLDGSLPLDGDLAVETDESAVSCHGARRVEALLESERDGETGVRSSAAETTVVVERVPPADLRVDRPEEGYELSVDPASGIEIRAATEAGMEYAAQTLVGLLSETEDGPAVPACRVLDWPTSEWRGLLVDPARGHVPVGRLEALVDMAARAKLNRLHLHLADEDGSALAIPAHPELTVEGRPHYTVAEMEYLVEYAAERSVEIVPEFEAPGHATRLLEVRPELRCDVENDEPSETTLCPGTERTYEFLADVVAELAAVFPSDVIHLGTDEWTFESTWSDCRTCRRRMAEEDIDTEQGLFHYFLRRAHETVAAEDRRMAAWNEEFDVAAAPDVPRDLLVQFWVVRPDDDDAGAKTSMAAYLREGFDVVNSYVPAAYVDRHATEDALLGWSPTTRPTVPDGRESQVLGGETLAWSGWKDDDWAAYYRRALPSTLPTFGDRLWNAGSIEDRDGFRRAVARHVLGPAPTELFSVYDELGGLILPVENDEKAHLYASMGGRTAPEAVADYRECAERLRARLDDGSVRFPAAAEAYVDCFEWLIRRAERDGRGVTDA